MLELLVVSTMTTFVWLVVLVSTCDCLHDPLLGCTLVGKRFVVVYVDIVRNGRVVLGDVIAFGVKPDIKLIGLKGESDIGCEAACLSCMVISDGANDVM